MISLSGGVESFYFYVWSNFGIMLCCSEIYILDAPWNTVGHFGGCGGFISGIDSISVPRLSLSSYFFIVYTTMVYS